MNIPGLPGSSGYPIPRRVGSRKTMLKKGFPRTLVPRRPAPEDLPKMAVHRMAVPRRACPGLQCPGGPVQASITQENLPRTTVAKRPTRRRQYLEGRQAPYPGVWVRQSRPQWFHSDWDTEVNYESTFVQGTICTPKPLSHVF